MEAPIGKLEFLADKTFRITWHAQVTGKPNVDPGYADYEGRYTYQLRTWAIELAGRAQQSRSPRFFRQGEISYQRRPVGARGRLVRNQKGETEARYL